MPSSTGQLKLQRRRVPNLPEGHGSALVDHEEPRNAVDAVSAGGFLRGIEQHGKGHFRARRVLLGGAAVVIDADGHDFEIGVRLVGFLIEGAQRRRFHAARAAPARPKSYHHLLLAAEIGERDGPAVEGFQREVRSGLVQKRGGLGLGVETSLQCLGSPGYPDGESRQSRDRQGDAGRKAARAYQAIIADAALAGPHISHIHSSQYVLRFRQNAGAAGCSARAWNCAIVGQLIKLRAGWKPALRAGFQPAAGCHPAPHERSMFRRSKT